MNNLNDFYEFVNKHSLALALFIIAIIETTKQVLQKKVEVAFVEKISKIQEEVKAEFVKQNENIKAELSFSNQHNLNLMAIEREAIFDYNKNFWVLQNLFRDLSFMSIKEDSITYYDELIINLDSVSNSFDLATSHLYLFNIKNETFLQKQLELTIKTIKYSISLKKKIIEVKNILEINKTNKIDFNVYEFEKVSTIITAFQDSKKEEYVEIIKSFRELILSLSDKFKAQ